MIQQIKELRVKIDGLHQLTKDLKPNVKWEINVATIPPFFTVEEYIELFEKTNYSIVNMPEGDKTIREIPTQYKEIEDAAKSLLLAKAWLGKLLGELGSDNPYSTGKREVKDIEPTADAAHLNEGISEYSNIQVQLGVNPSEIFNAEIYKRKNHIEKVDWLRSEIQSVIDEVYKILEINSRSRLTGENAWRHLCEAKMWLGFEFGRVRDES